MTIFAAGCAPVGVISNLSYPPPQKGASVFLRYLDGSGHLEAESVDRFYIRQAAAKWLTSHGFVVSENWRESDFLLELSIANTEQITTRDTAVASFFLYPSYTAVSRQQKDTTKWVVMKVHAYRPGIKPIEMSYGGRPITDPFSTSCIESAVSDVLQDSVFYPRWSDPGVTAPARIPFPVSPEGASPGCWPRLGMDLALFQDHLVVTNTENDSGAQEAGILVGDFLVSINGAPPERELTLDLHPSRPVTLVVFRNGNFLTMNVAIKTLCSATW